MGKLPLAPEKSCCLLIGANNTETLPVYKLKAIDPKVAENVRDLGFLTNKSFNFDGRCNSVVKIANFCTYNFFKVPKSKNLETYLRAYVAYVRPVVESGTTVFSPFKKRDSGILESA